MLKKRILLPRSSRLSIAAVGLIVWAAGPTAAQSSQGQEPPDRMEAQGQTIAEKPISCPYCDLAGADLSGRDLTDANLTGAILARANLKGAILNGAALIGADLTGANLNDAKLNDSPKGNANLSRANLTGASFLGAEMNGTDLQFAKMGGADFSNLDLTQAVFGPRIHAGVAGSRKTSFRNARLRRDLAVDAAVADVEGARWEPAAAVAPEADDIVCGRADLSGLTSRIYVANTGTDSDTCGTSYSSPCKTIGRGISRCAGSGCGVLVAWDEYQLADTLALRNGVNVYGGCLPRSQARPDYFSAVTAPDGGRPVVSASAINGGTILQGFQLNASTAAGTNAATSVALLVRDSSRLSVLDTELVAHRGAQGGTADHAADGAAGGNGSARDGGTVDSCANTSGGKGAVKMGVSVSPCKSCTRSCENSCQGYPGSPGTTGRSANGGQPGRGNCTACPISRGDRGTTGDAGGNASCGSKADASGDITGVFRGDSWIASAGGTGGQGGGGGGGGGGGAGGYRAGECLFCLYTADPGNSGGGGAAGGCPGGRGGGGQQGGASFALLALRSTVALTRCDIVSGTGGAGGNGGAGGRGGRGGSGAGGATNEAGGYGGDGGGGGAGGASGGGAGGNGGPAIGAALVGESKINASALVYYPGQSGKPGEGGAGGGAIVTGACTAPDGGNGVPGLIRDTNSY